MSTELSALWGALVLIIFLEGVLVAYGWLHLSRDSALKRAAGKALAFLYRNPFGAVILSILWLLLTVTTLGWVFLVALPASYLLLFALGRVAALIGLLTFGGILVATPFVWGLLILGLGRRYVPASA